MPVSMETNCHDLLHRWQIRMLESDWNFNQALDDTVQSFKGVYLQHDREVIAHALTAAFDTAASYLGFFPQPTYVEDQQISIDADLPWWKQDINLYTRHLVTFGRRKYSEISYNQSYSFLDEEEEDSINDIAHITVTTSVDVNEIQVFYRVDDGATSQANRRWRIPVHRMSKDSETNQVDIYIKLANIVKPDVWDNTFRSGGQRYSVNRELSDSFVSHVDVCRVYTDSSDAVRLLSYPDSESTEIIETSVDPIVKNHHYTDFRLAHKTLSVKKPFAIKVSYLSGHPLTRLGVMNSQLETAIIRLANTDLSMIALPLSHLSEMAWRDDREKLFNTSQRFVPIDYANPLGVLRGHFDAWIILKRFQDNLISKLRRVV